VSLNILFGDITIGMPQIDIVRLALCDRILPDDTAVTG
jgi:hypothetical protein